VPHIIFFFNLAIVWAMLWIEARRYRFYDAFRARVRMLEAHFLVPMVMENREMLQGEWKKLVCEDLILPCFKISKLEAVGRRLKRNYVFIFILIMIAWGTTDLAKGFKYRAELLGLLAGAAVVLSAALTWQQLGHWRDNESLFRHTLEVTAGNYVIHNSLGADLAARGFQDEAIGEYREALRLYPGYSTAHFNLGVALDQVIKRRRQQLTKQSRIAFGCLAGEDGDFVAKMKAIVTRQNLQSGVAYALKRTAARLTV